MQKSEKMNLNLFEDSDFVKPEFFNENTQIIDNALFQSASVVMGTYNRYHPTDEADIGLILEFEKTPVFIFLMSQYGLVMSFRGTSEAFDSPHAQYRDYKVSVTWHENSVQLMGLGCETLTAADVEGSYFALVI